MVTKPNFDPQKILTILKATYVDRETTFLDAFMRHEDQMVLMVFDGDLSTEVCPFLFSIFPSWDDFVRRCPKESRQTPPPGKGKLVYVGDRKKTMFMRIDADHEIAGMN